MGKRRDAMREGEGEQNQRTHKEGGGREEPRLREVPAKSPIGDTRLITSPSPTNRQVEINRREITEADLLSMSQEDLILNESFSFTALLQSDIIYKVHSGNGPTNIHPSDADYSQQAGMSYKSGINTNTCP